MFWKAGLTFERAANRQLTSLRGEISVLEFCLQVYPLLKKLPEQHLRFSDRVIEMACATDDLSDAKAQVLRKISEWKDCEEYEAIEYLCH